MNPISAAGERHRIWSGERAGQFAREVAAREVVCFSAGPACYRYGDLMVSSTLVLAGLPIAHRVERESSAVTLRLFGGLVEPLSDSWIPGLPGNKGVSEPCLAKTCGGLYLRFPGLVDFAIAQDGSHIGAAPASGTNEETLNHLLLDHVLPRVLAQRGRLVLHAGAVDVDGQTIAFLGDTGSGKSTLAASFHAAGCPLLSDDGLVLGPIDGGVSARPTYPSLRLWPASVTGLYAQLPKLAPMAHYSTKQRVMLDEGTTTVDPVPLAALYVLAPLAETGSAAISLTPLSPRDTCMAIVENSFRLDVTDTRRTAALLGQAANVTRQVPAFRLAYPREFDLLPSVRAAILDQRRSWVGGVAPRLSA